MTGMRVTKLLLPVAAVALVIAGCSNPQTATVGDPNETCSFDTTEQGVTATATGQDGPVTLVVGKDAPVPKELVTIDLCQGEGVEATQQDTVTVDYIGVGYKSREEFDSSYSRGEPATFPLSQVIPGWTQGVAGMKPGGARLLLIPADLAYGSAGAPPSIQPDEALAFVVEMDSIQPPPS